MNETPTFLDSKFKVVVTPLEVFKSDLSANEKLVCSVLYGFANSIESTAFPAINTISDMSSLSRSTVIRVLKTLEEKGFLEKETRYQYDHKKKTARQTSNKYTLGIPSVRVTPPQCQGDTPPSVRVTPPQCQGDTPRTIDLLTKDINNDLIDRVIESSSISEFLKSKPERLEIEHIEQIAQVIAQEKGKTGYNDTMFVSVLTRVLRTYKNGFKACLETSIQNEIKKQNSQNVSASSGSDRRRGSSRKPKINIIGDVPVDMVTDEEIAEMIEKFKELDDRADNPSYAEKTWR